MKTLLPLLAMLVVFGCKEKPKTDLATLSHKTIGTVAILPINKVAPNLPEGKYPLIISEAGDTIAYQLVADKILLDTAALGSVDISFSDNLLSFPAATNVRLGRLEDGKYIDLDEETRPDTLIEPARPMYYQAEGPMWENDLIGFRTYWDKRNGFDIFGKRSAALVLDKVDDDRYYHDLSDWGMDILKVGNSIGSGGIAIQVKDTVYRIGDADKETFHVIEEGPFYAALALTYDGVPISDRKYDVDNKIEIYKGLPGFISNVSVKKLQGDEQLIAGIVNMHSDTLLTASKEDFTYVYTYDVQAFLDKKLGMAIKAGNEDIIAHGEVGDKQVEVENTYYMALKLYADKPTSYTFFAAWELDPSGITDAEGFKQLLLKH